MVALVGAATAGAIFAMNATAQSTAAARDAAAMPRALEVSVASVRWLDTRSVERRFTGLVVARRGVDAAFQIGGLVDAVLVDRGDRVAEGTPLARLDDRRLRAARSELAASLAEAEAAAALARIEEDRARALLARAVGPQAAFDRAAALRRQADARVAALQARIAATEADLADAVLRAPFAVAVVARLAERGAMLGAGMPALRLIEDTGPEAQVGVPAAVAARLAPGQSVGVESRLGRLSAEVRAIEPRVDGAARTTIVVLRLPREAMLPAGEAVEMLLTEDIAERGFWAPLAALTTGPRGLWALHLVVDGPEGPVAQRAVAEALHVETARAFLRGPVPEAARLIVEGAHRVAPGQRVTPLAAQGGV
jgi:RND family efflux transporter MFP subunit